MICSARNIAFCAIGMILFLTRVLAAEAHERSSVTCPRTVTVPEQGFTPPAGWKIWLTAKHLSLAGGELIEGQIEKPPLVDLEDWDFKPQKHDIYSILCTYQRTGMRLIHRLPESARSCRILGTLPHGSLVCR